MSTMLISPLSFTVSGTAYAPARTHAQLVAAFNQVNSYFSEISLGTFPGWTTTVANTVALGTQTATTMSSLANAVSTADAATAAAGYTLSSYDIVGYTLPETWAASMGSDNAGHALAIPGNRFWVRDDDFASTLNPTILPSITCHEIGHCLGLEHCHSWYGGTNTNSASGTFINNPATSEEYVQGPDLMGAPGTIWINHPNMYEKVKIGYLTVGPQCPIFTASGTTRQDTTYTLDAADNPAAITNPRGVRIDIPTGLFADPHLGSGSVTRIWVECRDPDRFSPVFGAPYTGNLSGGILVSVSNSATGLDGSWLLDGSPGAQWTSGGAGVDNDMATPAIPAGVQRSLGPANLWVQCLNWDAANSRATIRLWYDPAGTSPPPITPPPGTGYTYQIDRGNGTFVTPSSGASGLQDTATYPVGSYTIRVRAIGADGQVGTPSSVSFSTSLSAIPTAAPSSATPEYAGVIVAGGTGQQEEDNFAGRASVLIGGVVYLAGFFTLAGTTGHASQYVLNAPVTRNKFSAYTAATGALLPWTINADADGYMIIPGPTGKVYCSGLFNNVLGAARSKVALVTTTGAGTLDTTFIPPAINGRVTGLAYDPSTTTLYISGTFTTVGGSGRGGLAALDATTGALKPWNPGVAGGTADGRRVLLNPHSSDQADIYVAGEYTTINGVARLGLACVQKDPTLTSPLVRSWSPDLTGDSTTTKPHDIDITPDGTRLIVATAGSDVGGDGNHGICYQLVNSQGALQRGNTRLWTSTAESDGGDHNACGCDNKLAFFGHHGDGVFVAGSGTNDGTGNRKLYAVHIADGSSAGWILNPQPNSIQGTYGITVAADRVLVTGAESTPRQAILDYAYAADLTGPGPGTGDTQPPTAPTTLTATAAGASSITLNWGGATDNIAVTNYEITRAGSVVATIGNVLTYTDSGLTASTSYTYTVKAVDAAGLKSPASVSASATTGSGGDVTAPTVPAGLAATATGATTIHLTWNASTDAVGVTGYRIRRGGSVIATTTAVTSLSTTPVANTPNFWDPAWSTSNNHAGRVEDFIAVNGVTYVASWAPNVDDPSGGTGTHTNLPNLTAIRGDTKALKTAWQAAANGKVRCLAKHPVNGIVYAGGAFTNMGGSARASLAGYTPLTGPTDASAFTLSTGTGNVAADGDIYDIVFNAAGTVAWVIGDFSNIGGLARRGVARFTISGTTWTIDSGFNASRAAFIAGGGGRAGVLKGDETKLVIGWFPGSSGTDVSAVPCITAHDPATGAAQAWTNKFYYTAIGNEHPGVFEAWGDTEGVYFSGLVNGGNSVCYLDWNGAGANAVTYQGSQLSANTSGGPPDSGCNMIWYFSCDGNGQCLAPVSYGGKNLIAVGHHGDVVALQKNNPSGTSAAPGPVGNTTSHGLFMVTRGSAGGTLDAYGNPPGFSSNGNGAPLKLWAIYQDTATGDVHTGGDFTEVVGEATNAHQRYTDFAGTASGSSITFDDANLAQGTNYTYTISAFDAAGNESAQSTSANATTTSTSLNPITRYTFENITSTSITDDSGNGHTATAVNYSGTPPTTPGPNGVGKALTFAGASQQRIEVADASDLDPLTAYTLSAWVYLIPIDTDPLHQRWEIMEKSASTASVGSYGINIRMDTTPLYLLRTFSFYGGVFSNHDSNTPILPNQWQHCAATYDGSQVKLYINGSLDATAAQTGTIGNSTDKLVIGAKNRVIQLPVQTEAFWNGSLDEVQVFDRALTASEIAQLATPPQGQVWTNIAGATARTYSPITSDVGRILRVKVVATNRAGTATAFSDPTSSVIAFTPPTIPRNLTAPSITPNTYTLAGTTLTCDAGTWDQADSFAFTWLRLPPPYTGTPVQVQSGSSNTYTRTTGDNLAQIKCRVIATNVLGSTSADTPYTAQPGAPSNLIPPSIDDTTPTVGQILHVDPGQWSSDTTSLNQQWIRTNTGGSNIQSITGATSAAYTVATTDLAYQLAVQVTATNANGITTQATTAWTSAVAAAGTAPVLVTPPTVAAPPAIYQGSVIVATPATWQTTPTSDSYQWQRQLSGTTSWLTIVGATSPTYTIKTNGTDDNYAFRLVETATNAGGTTMTTTPATTVVIGAPIPWDIAFTIPSPGGTVSSYNVPLTITITGPQTPTRVYAEGDSLPWVTLSSIGGSSWSGIVPLDPSIPAGAHKVRVEPVP